MQTTKGVLITGGSGVIGTRLTAVLLDRGYEVSHLSRSSKPSGVKNYVWDPAQGTVDHDALRNVHVIVHLAGAPIADKRWNERRKADILSSRVDSARLLVDTLKRIPRHKVTTLVSASGISYYGLGEPFEDAFTEADPPADDFMARVTMAWEKEVLAAGDLGIRTVMLRTGVVLTSKGGALEKLAMPVRFFVGAPLGSGRQYLNWIHIEDVCNLYVKAIEDPLMKGPYNAVAPHPITNEEMTRLIARTLRRPLWLPPVPGFAVRLIAGEVAEVVLNGGRVSSQKIEKTGFKFSFVDAAQAVNTLLTEN